MDRVLIIKHGALGDFVMSIGTIKSVIARHPGARFTLVTMSPFVNIGQQMGVFEDIIVDNRKGWEYLRVLSRIASGGFTHIYDFQCRTRTRMYWRLLRWMLPAGRYEWYNVQNRDKVMPGNSKPIHYTLVKKHKLGCGSMTRESLAFEHVVSDISFLHGKAEHFNLLPERFVLLIPGCSANNAYKRWPSDSFNDIAKRLWARGIKVVVIGTKAESAEIEAICQANPENAVNMMGKTGILDIPQLALRALCSLGNDTGPSHMASLSGAPTIAVYDKRTSHAKLQGPRSTSIASSGDISLITPDRVWEAMQPYLTP